MIATEYISIESRGFRDVLDLTPEIRRALENHDVSNGIVTVFAPGSTAGITTVEFETGLKKDLDVYLEKLFPYGDPYAHHETWHDDNGSSHLQAALIGPSVTIPVVDGELTLGTWQQVVLVDCDTRSRSRKIIIQMLHE